MADIAAAVLASVLVVQLPIGLYVRFDARRRGLRHSDTYWLGVIAPAGGLIVIAYYFSNRDRFAQSDDTS